MDRRYVGKLLLFETFNFDVSHSNKFFLFSVLVNIYVKIMESLRSFECYYYYN